MEPDAVRLAALGDLGDRVDGGRRRRPDRGDDRAGVLELEQRPAGAGTRRRPAPCAARARAAAPPCRRTSARARSRATTRRPGRSVARGGERDERARRRRVLDVAVQPVRKAEELREPVERHLLELLERGRRAPEDPDLVQTGGEQLGEDRRLGARRREVREEARALPVREPGQEHRVEIVEDRAERLRLVRRRRGERGADRRPGSTCASTGQLAHALEVGRDPLERERAVVAEGRSLRAASRSAPTAACSAPAPS